LDRSEVGQLFDKFLIFNPELESVDLKWNAIQSLPDKLFSRNRKLIKATLSGNHFTRISRNFFKNNPGKVQTFLCRQ